MTSRDRDNFENLDASALGDAIELLTEGELSDDECQQLLRHIEQQPNYWRTLAIAFVEQQRLRRSIQSTCSKSLTNDFTSRLQPSYPLRGRASWKQIFTIAASMVVMFMIGYGAAGRVQNSGSIATQSHAPAPHVPSVEASHPAEDSQPFRMFEVANNIAGYVEWQENSGVRLLPLFHGSEVDDAWLESHPLLIDEQWTKSLSRAGWVATPSRRMISVKLAGGDTYTIPFDDVRYRFVGRELY